MPSDGGDKASNEHENAMNQLTTEMWSLTIEHIGHVLEADKYFGFIHFDYADPTIDEILNRIDLLEPMVTAVLTSERFKADAERSMKLLNCQQALHLIRRTNVSLKNADEAEYRQCIHKLKSQRQH